MRSLVIVCFLALVAVALARPETYSDRFDNLDLDEILANRRLLVPYVKCFLDQGKCSADGKEFKAHIKEALQEDCAKCTEKQRRGARKAISHIINKEADYWNQLVEKYDPERKFAPKYEKEFKGAK